MKINDPYSYGQIGEEINPEQSTAEEIQPTSAEKIASNPAEEIEPTSTFFLVDVFPDYHLHI